MRYNFKLAPFIALYIDTKGPVVNGAMCCGKKKLKATVAVPPAPVWLSSQWSLGPEFHVSHDCQLMIRVVMKRSRGLCIDLLAFALRLRKTLETLS